jgi:hypothetical protein
LDNLRGERVGDLLVSVALGRLVVQWDLVHDVRPAGVMLFDDVLLLVLMADGWM